MVQANHKILLELLMLNSNARNHLTVYKTND